MNFIKFASYSQKFEIYWFVNEIFFLTEFFIIVKKSQS